MADKKRRSPWFWVPSLYFSQGIPYVMVMTLSVVMYKRLGISNTDTALYTSWLYLPWVLKPLWSPLVDITRTKRFWVVLMQFLVAFALASVAFTVRGAGFFKWSLFLFWIMAFASATHDIAADGFYMLGLSPHEQAWWVGLRSTFYRTAMIVGSGLLVVLAGLLESHFGLAPVALPVSAQAAGPANGGWNPIRIPAQETPGALHLVASPGALTIERAATAATDTQAAVGKVEKWNRDNGFIQESPPPKAEPPAWWSIYVSNPAQKAWQALISHPLGDFLRRHFPKKGESPAGMLQGNAGVIYLALSQAPETGRRIVVNVEPRKTAWQFLGLAKGDKGISVRGGDRLVFNSTNWNRGAMVAFSVDPKLTADVTATFQATAGDIPAAWSVTLLAVAALFLAFSCWHGVMLPRPPGDGAVISRRSLFGEFFATLGSFFRKPGLGLALPFILLYRFDEAQLSKVISPFLLDARAAGGLGLTTSQVGLAYGTFGVLALTAGGLVGGFLAAQQGLRRMLPYMIGAMYLPKLVFLGLAFLQPDNFLAVCGAVALEQLGYGFGFTAFMLYLLYFAAGPHKTAHYAICTGFMALGMMVPGMWSGWLADTIGYRHFFAWVICSAVPGLIIALQLKIDPQFGKKAPAI